MHCLEVILKAMQAHNEALRELAQEFRTQNYRELRKDIQTLTHTLQEYTKRRDPLDRLRP